jgi:NADPH:quinone reductase-like Zn-dependent oxidoreductase
MPYQHLGDFAKYVSEGKLYSFKINGRWLSYAIGKVKPFVDPVFAFEDVQKAYDRLRLERPTGKAVVKVDPSVD